MHRSDGKFTLNLCNTKGFKTKNAWNKLLVHDNLRTSFALNRYIQVILQVDSGFQGFTQVLVIPTFHI